MSNRGGVEALLKRDLAAAVRSGDKVRIRAAKALLDELAGRRMESRERTSGGELQPR